MNSLNSEISEQRNSLEEKILNLQEREKMYSMKINNINNQISQMNSDRNKLEDNEHFLKNQIDDLNEEIKLMKEKFHNTLNKVTEEFNIEKE